MPLPSGYEWLDQVHQRPRTIDEAVKLLGVAEVVGTGSNKTIIGWRDELNHAGVKITGYSDDDIPWCGLFAAIVAHRADKVVPENPLWARNWLNFGKQVDDPVLGDILVFARNGGGHVAFYVGEDSQCYHVIGGNQGNRVSITRIEKYRCIGKRRPAYSVTPAGARQFKLTTKGPVSRNEA